MKKQTNLFSFQVFYLYSLKFYITHSEMLTIIGT